MFDKANFYFIKAKIYYVCANDHCYIEAKISFVSTKFINSEILNKTKKIKKSG